MVKLTEEMKAAFPGAKNYYVSTCSKAAMPNVVPISFLKVYDDETLLIADNFFNKTAKNLQENPHVAISFWGDKGGYQIKGDVTVHKSGKPFDDAVAFVKAKYPNMAPKAAVVVKITDVYQIKSGPDAGKKLL